MSTRNLKLRGSTNLLPHCRRYPPQQHRFSHTRSSLLLLLTFSFFLLPLLPGEDTNPKIFDAGVYGVPDEKWGEVGKASIILKEGAKMTAEEVVQFLQGNIGKFKIPKYIEFVDGIPRTASGKIRRYQLVERFKREEIPVKT